MWVNYPPHRHILKSNVSINTRPLPPPPSTHFDRRVGLIAAASPPKAMLLKTSMVARGWRKPCAQLPVLPLLCIGPGM